MGDVTDIAELPRLAAGRYVPVLFYKSQVASAFGKSFFPSSRCADLSGVEVGEKCLLEKWMASANRIGGTAGAAIRR